MKKNLIIRYNKKKLKKGSLVEIRKVLLVAIKKVCIGYLEKNCNEKIKKFKCSEWRKFGNFEKWLH